MILYKSSKVGKSALDVVSGHLEPRRAKPWDKAELRDATSCRAIAHTHYSEMCLRKPPGSVSQELFEPARQGC